MTDNFIDEVFDKFNNVTKKPEKLLSAPEKLITSIKDLIKDTYDFTKKEEATINSDVLPSLIVDNFDVEQIWQQLELQNNYVLTNYLQSVSNLVANRDRLWFIDQNSSVVGNEDEETSENEEKNSEGENEEKNSEGENEELNSDGENDEEGEIDDLEEESKVDNEEGVKEKKKKGKGKRSIVDDEFFKLHEMEDFLIKEEENLHKNDKPGKAEDDSDEESVDLFDMKSDEDLGEDTDEEDEEKVFNPKYNEFFGRKDENSTKGSRKRKREQEDKEEEETAKSPSEGENETAKSPAELRKDLLKDNESIESTDEEKVEGIAKSSLELREQRLRQRIEDLEQHALMEKSWQLKGEITGDKRPQNSLLEEVVDFDMTVRPAPVITEETTYKLEDIIRQRIKDKVWDDVERKTKVADTPLEYKKKLTLDQEKSKHSLAQIYEEEYLKEKEALDPDAADKPEEEPKEHVEVKQLMKNLFSKLDALSNFHFTPKSVAPELRIVNNLPAINMEEVAPVATSDATLLAPEEVKQKPKGELMEKEERTDTDKKRERRKKKLKQRVHSNEKKKRENMLEKLKPGLGNKYSKEKAAKLLEKVTKDRNIDRMDESNNFGTKSSTAFFAQLQDEVKGQIKSKIKPKGKNNKQQYIAKKLKL